jgi:hypothetical protein
MDNVLKQLFPYSSNQRLSKQEKIIRKWPWCELLKCGTTPSIVGIART